MSRNAPSAPPPMRTISLPPMLAARATMPSLDEKDARSMEFYMQLCSFKEGVLFAGRYKIESERIQGKPQCRYAINERTGQRVFLKFFRRESAEFANAVKIHRALEPENKFVSRLLESIENIHGFPPCLVFERGEDDLSHRMKRQSMTPMDQKALLYSVLESLHYLHSLGIAHGHLKPSNILWFEAERTWKLGGLEYAVQSAQQPNVEQSDEDTEDAASDSSEEAEDTEIPAVHLTPAADMWSYGIIAFEILTCSAVINSVGILEYMERRLQQTSADADGTVQRWLSANPRGRIFSGNVEEYNLRFIQTFLHENPDERRTAADALGDPLFRSAMDLYQRMDSQENSPVGVLEEPNEAEMPDWVWTVGIADRLQFGIDVEYLPKGTGGNLPFDQQMGKPSWAYRDSDLPLHPVHYINVGHTYRFRIRVVPDSASGLVVERILSVSVKPPDSDAVALAVKQHSQDDQIVASALFQPSTLGSKRLQMISTHWGAIEEKYVRLEVGIKLLFGKPVSRDLEFHKAIYCKMIAPSNKLRLHRFMGMVKHDEALRRSLDQK